MHNDRLCPASADPHKRLLDSVQDWEECLIVSSSLVGALEAVLQPHY